MTLREVAATPPEVKRARAAEDAHIHATFASLLAEGYRRRKAFALTGEAHGLLLQDVIAAYWRHRRRGDEVPAPPRRAA